MNQAYDAAGRALPGYADPTLTGTIASIKAIHVDELCAAVRALE